MNASTPAFADAYSAGATRVLTQLGNADFGGLAQAFEPELSAIVSLPAGVFEWRDRAAIRSVFEQWFRDADEYAITDFGFARLGGRLHLRWRIAVAGGFVGPRRHVVEQQLYADLGPTGLIRSIALLCSGFHTEEAR